MKILQTVARNYQDGMLTDREFLAHLIVALTQLHSETPETSNFSTPIVDLADKLAGPVGV